MTDSTQIPDAALERQGRRMIRPALRFLAIALVVLVPGIVLAIVGSGGLLGLGVALILLSTIPGSFGLALIVSSSVARWAARHKLFA